MSFYKFKQLPILPISKFRFYTWFFAWLGICKLFSPWFLFRPLKMRINFGFGCVLFFFVFHAKSAVTNNHRTGLSDKSY